MANVTIYVEGWIEYRVDDAQALLDAAGINNPDRAPHQLASHALTALTQENFKREIFNARGASVVDEDISFSPVPPE